MKVRLARDEDFRVFFEKEPPEIWTALLAEDDEGIAAMGGIVHGDDGVAVGFVDTKRRINPVTLHRQAKRFLDAMRQAGEPAIYTSCDETIDRAQAWLMRLGFKLLPERVDGTEIWRWQRSE